MKSIVTLLLLFGGTMIVWGDYPNQMITRKKSVHFGQTIEVFKKDFRAKIIPDESPVAREGIDKSANYRGTKIDFDSGRLVSITFESNFDFRLGVLAFKESWKNFPEIDGLKIHRDMDRKQFLSYLRLWEKRASEFGAKKIEGNRMLRENEYSISESVDEWIDMIHFSFGPDRSTGKGGTWSDACSVMFVSEFSAKFGLGKRGQLDNITVRCDEFNTNARKK